MWAAIIWSKRENRETVNQGFSTYHPVVNFIFFVMVIGTAMFFLHPVLLGISFTGALAYALYLEGRKILRFLLIFLLPMMVVLSLVNPLFNHRGVTILTYIRDNPITWESIYYGMVTGLMLGAVILWFSCYNQVMTSDKFIYLFGRLIPSLSLIFSMVLRFVPRFQDQYKVILQGQKSLGREVEGTTLSSRIRRGLKVTSMMLTWSLENAIDTADSMKARGYGLPGRTAFSTYRLDGRDRRMLVVLLLMGGMLALGVVNQLYRIQYFPSIKVPEAHPLTWMFFLAYGVLCYLPLIVSGLEEYKWKLLQSKI